MRLRRKPWARPELAACPFFVDEPAALRGRWAAAFSAPQPMELELGCGKGTFIASLASRRRECNYVAVDLKSEVLALAKRRAEEEYARAGAPVDNLLLLSQDIERLPLIFQPGADRFRRIYINFCNPWPKPRHHKHRLTHTRQLGMYRDFLIPRGELHFKTDDDALFEDTLGYLAQAGYEILALHRDLHAAGLPGNIPTEHEELFAGRGVPIKYLIARPMDADPPLAGKEGGPAAP